MSKNFFYWYEARYIISWLFSFAVLMIWANIIAINMYRDWRIEKEYLNHKYKKHMSKEEEKG